MDYNEQTTALLIILMMLMFLLIFMILIEFYTRTSVWFIFIEKLSNWWDSVWTLPPDYYYNEPNKNKGKNTTMYGGAGGYNRPKFYNVWVSRYNDLTDTSKGVTITKENSFTGNTATYDWKWITLKGGYGWVQKLPAPPPPEPSMYISEGAKEEADRILSEYAANKKEKEAIELAKIDTKMIKTV